MTTPVRFFTSIDYVMILICVMGKRLATLLTSVCLLFGMNFLMPSEAGTPVQALSIFLIVVFALFILIAYIMLLLLLVMKYT